MKKSVFFVFYFNPSSLDVDFDDELLLSFSFALPTPGCFEIQFRIRFSKNKINKPGNGAAPNNSLFVVVVVVVIDVVVVDVDDVVVVLVDDCS